MTHLIIEELSTRKRYELLFTDSKRAKYYVTSRDFKNEFKLIYFVTEETLGEHLNKFKELL